LPDRSSDKVFRLQVAAFSARDAADRLSERIRDVGFNVEVEQEHTGAIFRVLVTGISASDVHAASVRLGSLGFGQIWVRE
jgi:cell division septation protein DedD